MASLVDYLSTWFISDEEIAMREEVAAAQQARLDQLQREGKVDAIRYITLSGEVQEAGTMQRDYRDENDNFFAVIPWWIYLGAGLAIFFYLGGFIWLRGILARK